MITTPGTTTDPNYDITQPYLGLIQKYRPKPDEADQDTQRKIAKGNAIAEAFRVLIDSVGAAKGGDVVKREAPTNAVLQAVDKYQKQRDQNKAEQSGWDKLELGQGLEALKTKSAQEYQNAKTKESQVFQSGEAEKGRQFQSSELGKSQEFTHGENALNRAESASKTAQQEKEFNQTLGFNKAKTTEEQAIEREKIQADREKVQAMYPYTKLSGLSIADEEKDNVLRIPNQMIEQTLAFMEKDPSVQGNIGFIKAQFNTLGNTQEVKYLIAQNFANLSPQTKDKIRALAANATSVQGASPAPTIKTSKNSTMVKVQQPVSAPNTQNNEALQPEQIDYIQKIIAAKNYNPEVKRSAVYNYLTTQGYDGESAKSAAEAVYQSLIGK